MTRFPESASSATRTAWPVQAPLLNPVFPVKRFQPRNSCTRQTACWTVPRSSLIPNLTGCANRVTPLARPVQGHWTTSVWRVLPICCCGRTPVMNSVPPLHTWMHSPISASRAVSHAETALEGSPTTVLTVPLGSSSTPDSRRVIILAATDSTKTKIFSLAKVNILFSTHYFHSQGKIYLKTKRLLYYKYKYNSDF